MHTELRPPRRPARWIAAAVLCLACATSTGAHAQDRDGKSPPHFDLLFLLGVGGDVDVEAGNDDLQTGYGLALGVSYPLHPYFALGGRLGFVSWQSEAADDADLDRSARVDLAIVPAATFRVSDAVELYIGLALGPSMDFFGPNEQLDEVFGGAVDVSPAVGLGITPLLGARFWLGDSVGLTAELGVTLVSYDHDVDVDLPAPLPDVTGQLDVDITQPSLDLGVFFDM